MTATFHQKEGRNASALYWLSNRDSVEVVREDDHGNRRVKVFPLGTTFAVHPAWDQVYRQHYTELLGWAAEGPLSNEPPDTECYRLFGTALPKVVRIAITAERIDLIAKEVYTEEATATSLAHLAVREIHRTLEAQQVDHLRTLLTRAEFWSLPSYLPPQGLDGWHEVFEACVGARYHLVDRWNPRDRSGFANICRYGWSLYDEAFGIRRPRWRFWK